jgi:Mce-associated membrane protein
VAIALVVIAAGCAGWFGWSWYHAQHSGSVASARLRDQVLRQGEQAVQNFNTLDYRHLSQGLSLWQSSSTGTLRTEITRGRAQFEQAVRSAKTVTTALVLDGALTSLNPQSGTASIIVALQITVQPQTGQATTKQSRLAGTLAQTGSGWKLSALSQVPVGTAGPAPSPSPSTSP